MNEKQAEEKAAIEREVVSRRKFSMEEAIAREGAGTMKGVSVVPVLKQAQQAIRQYIRGNVRDSSGALVRMLELRLENNAVLVGRHLRDPLEALEVELRWVLGKDAVFREFVRQVDQKFGEMYRERPHFQRPGQAAHPDDEYTHQSVRGDLEQLLALVDAR